MASTRSGKFTLWAHQRFVGVRELPSRKGAKEVVFYYYSFEEVIITSPLSDK